MDEIVFGPQQPFVKCEVCLGYLYYYKGTLHHSTNMLGIPEHDIVAIKVYE